MYISFLSQNVLSFYYNIISSYTFSLVLGFTFYIAKVVVNHTVLGLGMLAMSLGSVSF